MSSNKRPAFDMKNVTSKIARLDQKTASQSTLGASSQTKNPYLSAPVDPKQAIHIFLTQVRKTALNYLPKESVQNGHPVTQPFCEVEARLGILKVPFALPEKRVTSSGAKHVNGRHTQAFSCAHLSATKQAAQMSSGVSRNHFVRWTGAGVSELSPLSKAFGVKSSTTDSRTLKLELAETHLVETVYSGYPQERRAAFPGVHDPSVTSTSTPSNGQMEYKERLATLDLCIPAAPYDLRVSLASEKVVDPHLRNQPPPGWQVQRIKRRRSYTRADKTFAWQLDVTEVTTQHSDPHKITTVDYEIEMELQPHILLQLINEKDDAKLANMTKSMATQLWWILSQINPLTDPLDVEECLRDHPNSKAVQVALATCGALRAFSDRHGTGTYEAPIGKSSPPPASLGNVKFIGCMPVNFSRHDIESIQRSPDNAYFLSEKTDGVRHFMIFTGDTVVLVDRAMRGKQPMPLSFSNDNNESEPFSHIVPLIQPGTVLDGEVVMNRRGDKPRPIFIVFDVLAVSTTQAVLHLPFEQRLKHLRQASFRTQTANVDMFDMRFVEDRAVALPLVRKNFVKRTSLDELLSHVVEEQGMRCYRNGPSHNHLTDGIIFQPNRPYVCGTDVKLLKWKYLDTATVDVEILPLRHSDEDDVLRVGCLGEEQTRVDMTRYVLLPKSERMRLEADRMESRARRERKPEIAEVGFDPETGDWYYLTMRDDKIAPNHISTVLGTMLELAESLSTDELRYRMSVPAGSADTYRKDLRGMMRQLLDHQRKSLLKSSKRL